MLWNFIRGLTGRTKDASTEAKSCDISGDAYGRAELGLVQETQPCPLLLSTTSQTPLLNDIKRSYSHAIISAKTPQPLILKSASHADLPNGKIDPTWIANGWVTHAHEEVGYGNVWYADGGIPSKNLRRSNSTLVDVNEDVGQMHGVEEEAARPPGVCSPQKGTNDSRGGRETVETKEGAIVKGQKARRTYSREFLLRFSNCTTLPGPIAPVSGVTLPASETCQPKKQKRSNSKDTGVQSKEVKDRSGRSSPSTKPPAAAKPLSVKVGSGVNVTVLSAQSVAKPSRPVPPRLRIPPSTRESNLTKVVLDTLTQSSDPNLLSSASSRSTSSSSPFNMNAATFSPSSAHAPSDTDPETASPSASLASSYSCASPADIATIASLRAPRKQDRILLMRAADGCPLMKVPVDLLGGGGEGLTGADGGVGEAVQLVRRKWKRGVVENADHRHFLLLSYNILAPPYATPHKYPHLPEQYLAWPHRLSRILPELAYPSADFICLQEVLQIDYTTHILPYLARCGYAGTFEAKPRPNPLTADGCCIFWRKERVRMVGRSNLSYAKRPKACGFGKEVEEWVSRFPNIALCGVFELRNRPGCRVRVVTTHLHWDPACEDVKLVQALMLVEWIGEMEGANGFGRDVPTVLAGDLNSLRGERVMEFLEKGSVVPGTLFEGRDFGKWSVGREQRSFATEVMDGAPTPAPDITSPTKRVWASGSRIQSWTKLENAYTPSDIPYTNKTLTFTGTIDHVLVTPSIAVTDVLGGVDDDLPGGEGYMEKIPSLPSQWIPSDHMSLGVWFKVREWGSVEEGEGKKKEGRRRKRKKGSVAGQKVVDVKEGKEREFEGSKAPGVVVRRSSTPVAGLEVVTTTRRNSSGTSTGTTAASQKSMLVPNSAVDRRRSNDVMGWTRAERKGGKAR
ncbi:Glucose-repressible alcohol dehydrogenase transcriptional effector [Rhizophlyctis rosea]|nr:Glucose-repressible alcohol dehydrogenase transcriptional effector [Rhizophlyctis rosea]